MDDDVSPLDSSLPWLWIIEYLASFKEVDTSILHDLIEMAPELPEDLGKNTREMVALRCLEDLFGSSNGITNDVPSTSDLKVEFDLSESCEDVLQCILHETSVSDLKMAGPELLKWDVHPFIMHKRASVPKCALQQLKDTILEGTNPDAVSLKESSGLVCVNESDRMHVDDSDQGLRTCRPDGSGNHAQVMAERNLIPGTLENGNALPGDDLHNRKFSPSKRDRSDLATENLAGHIHESQDSMNDCDDLLVDFRKFSPSKRDRSDLATENLAGHIHESQDSMNDCDDLLVNVKKLKQDPSCTDQPVGQSSIPLHGDELVESVPKRVVRVTEGEACDLQKDSQVGGLQRSRFSEDASKRLWQSSDVETEKVQYNQINVDHNANKMPQDTSGDIPAVQFGMVDETNDAEPRTSTGAPLVRLGHKDSVDEPKDKDDHFFQPKSPSDVSLDGLQRKINPNGGKGGMENVSKEEMSSDSDEYHDERIDVAKKKSHFLSSQCTLSQNSLATADWTEQNLCVKCNNNGQLLVCSTSGCPLVVHENCLGSPAKFDDRGNFYCPFCAYSLAISEYLEAKKKASLARKELAAFIHMGLEHHPKELTESLERKKNSSSRNGDKDLAAKIHENEHVGGREHNQANQNGEHVNELNDHPFQKSMGDKQRSEPSASGVNVDLPCTEEEANTISGKVCVSIEEKEEEKMVQECLLEGQHDQVQADHQCDGDNLSCKNMEIVPVNQRETEGRIEKEVLQQQITDLKEEPVCVLNIDGEETSEGENDKFIISNYSIRFRRRETQYTFPSTPQLRRKKVPWTAKEEEILKEGVQKFSSVDDRNVPWKKILEFGSSVFLNGRTPIDLKDKWRNMCKGSPRSK